MRRQLVAVGATLTASALLVTTGAEIVAAATPQTTRANAALRYLYGQVGTHGDIAGSTGTTEDTVIGIADNGYDPATLKGASGTSAYDYLSAKAATITTAGGTAKYVLTWLAAGRPAAIDGSALLTKLNTATGSGGYLTSKGTFRNASGETANAYSQSLAVLADVAAGHALPANATAWLACAQRSDGGFGNAINDAAPAPAGSCGDTTSDTNDTAIILQALGAARMSSAFVAARAYLHTAQQSDGGFGFAAGQPSDPSSDAVVIQALLAIGDDPTGPAWTVPGGNPLNNLESFADPHGSGGYVFPGNTAPDAFTTAGIPQALALKPYAAATSVASGLAPPAAPGPSPRPRSTPGAAVAPVVPATGAGTGLPMGLAGMLLVGGGAAAGANLRRRRPRAP